MSGHTASGPTGEASGQTALAGTAPPRGLGLAGGVLGFALGGFFDGIALHQLLQWHHLFSLVPGETWRDMQNQIMMDGWFHVLHYVIALVGIWLLWRARPGVTGAAADRRLLGAALIGFGAWQAVDTVVFHWALMIHRVRVGVPNPLAYDIGWFVVFGVPTLLAGWYLWRRGGRGDSPGPLSGPRRPVAASLLTLLVLVAGPVAALPSANTDATMVVFRPGTTAADAFAAVAAADGRVMWAHESGELLAVRFDPAAGAWASAWRLYRHGALLVGNTPVLAGCLGWMRG